MKDYDQGNAPDVGKDLAQAASGEASRRVEIDIEKYQAYLDGSDLTPAQKEDFLRALWSVIVSFVDLGFGVHPAQQACGQVEKTLDPLPQGESDGLNSPDSDLTTTFNDAPEGG